VKVKTLPGGNTIQTSYIGPAATVTDQVGRKIKREVDSLGRLVKVTEPDVTGAHPRRRHILTTCPTNRPK
jgi:hypothetical protein